MAARTASGDGERGDPLAERAIADLIVVLEEAHEGGGRQVRGGLAAGAAPVPGPLALEREALGEASAEMRQRRLVVAVVAAALAGQEHVQRVVHVVVPLGLVERAPAVRPSEVARLVGAVLQHQVHAALAGGPVGHRAGQLLQEVTGRLVHDRVDRVEAQAVEVVLLDPVERVVDHERAHHLRAGPVVVDPVAPRGLVPRVEEVGRVAVQIVALGPEVVVDDVEEDGEAARVRGVHQRLEVLGPAVGRLGGVEEHAVVAPAPAAREVGHRHQLQRGDAEGDQMIEPLGHGRVGAGRGEGADVQLVEHEPLRREPDPGAVGPGMGQGIHDLARAVHVAGLEARGRIGHEQLAVDAEAVARARGRVARHVLGPSARVARHRHRAPRLLEPELDLARAGSPEAEPRGAVLADLRAERHPMRAARRRARAHGRPASRARSATGKWANSAGTGSTVTPSNRSVATVSPEKRSR